MTNQTKWAIDQSHSELAFKVRHLMIAHVKGTFKTFDASIYTTGKDFATVDIDVWIDASSVSTGDEKRDAHLQSAEFFDVEHHKQILFKASTLGIPNADGIREMFGDLTIKGITKSIKLQVEFGGIIHDPWKNEKAGFTISGKLKRSDWTLNWNSTLETGGVLVGEEVMIMCEVELMNVGQKGIAMEHTYLTELNETP